MKQWLSRMKLAHKMVLGFLGLIALPFTLLSVFSFVSVASHYEHQLAQDGQYMLNMVVSDVNEKMDHVEMLMQVLSRNQNLLAFLSHDYDGAVSHEEYQKLMRLRKTRKALQEGTVRFRSQGDLFVMERQLQEEFLVTVINNTDCPQNYTLSGNNVRDLLSEKAFEGDQNATLVEIPPFSAMILEKIN